MPTRRLILERLKRGPSTVRELADGLPVSRPAVSQHLKILKQARLVRDRPVGAKRIYVINAEGLDELRAYIEQFWKAALTSFKTVAESKRRKPR